MTTLYLRKKTEYYEIDSLFHCIFCQLSEFFWLWLTFYLMSICPKYISVLFATNFQKYQFLGLTVIKRAEVGWRKYYHAYTMDPQLHIFSKDLQPLLFKVICQIVQKLCRYTVAADIAAVSPSLLADKRID